LDLDSSFKVIFFVLKAISLNLLIAVEEYKKVNEGAYSRHSCPQICS
jgi:hypothetical protein